MLRSTRTGNGLGNALMNLTRSKTGRPGVLFDMRKRWCVALRLVGLVLFSAISSWSFRRNVESFHFKRFFYWSWIRLDSDPRNLRGRVEPCTEDLSYECGSIVEIAWVDPGGLTKILIVAAFPAFLVATPLVAGLARVGVSEVWSFMISMPLLIGIWFYYVGWAIDRWRYKHPGHS